MGVEAFSVGMRKCFLVGNTKGTILNNQKVFFFVMFCSAVVENVRAVFGFFANTVGTINVLFIADFS